MQAPSEPLDPSILAEHERFLRELSGALVRGAADAEDVVQEVGLAALRHPPRTSARAWIARVARGIAARHWRDEERRVRRERRVAKRDALPSSSELVQRAELSRALLEVILELEEPYRSTVMLRYFEGHSPRVIAEAHGVAEGTVHVRLHRALGKLRARLDRDGGRERWMSALAPFALGLPTRESAAWWSVMAMKGMSGKSVVLVGLVLLLAALAPLGWWLLSSRDFALATDTWRTSEIEDENAPRVTASSASELVRAAAPHTDAVESVVDPRANPELLEVAVVDARSGAPAPRARVLHLDEVQHQQAFTKILYLSGSAEHETRRLGTEHAADEAGTAWLPRTRGRAFAYAELDGRSGLVELKPGVAEPVRLAIQPFHELVIEVVDIEGHRLRDVPVKLVTPVDVFHNGSSSHVGMWRGRTGADGTARARYAPAAFASSSHPLTLIASFDIGEMHREGVEFSIEHPPREPLRLVRTAWGSVVVEVEDPEGQPLREMVLVGMECSYAEAQREGTMSFAGGSAMTDTGRAVFDSVALGLDLRLFVWTLTGWKDVSIESRGPREDGEEVRVRARLTGRDPMLRGRVVYPDGRVAANTSLQGVLRRPSAQWWLAQTVQLDAEGRFRFPYNWTQTEGEAPILELIEWRSVDGADLPNGPTACAEIPTEIGPEGCDLGDLVLTPPSLPFAGTVRDDRGAPIADVSIRVLPVVLEGENPHEIKRIDRLATRTNTAGRFECLGPWPARNCMLRVEAEGHALVMHGPVAPGSKSIEIVLARGGALEGRLLIAPELPIEELTLFVAGDENARAAHAVPDAGGRFRVEGIAPGTRALSVMFERKVLARVDGIEISTGETTLDPRCDPLDLRELTRRVRLHIREPRGRELEIVYFASLRSGVREWARRIYPDSNGRVELFTTRTESELWVGATGCLPVRVDPDRDPCIVTLRRGPRVRIVANPPLNQVPFGGEATRSFVRMAEPDADAACRAYCEDLGDIELNARGEGLCDLPRAGHYALHWPDLENHVTPFEVLDLVEEQVVRVHIPWEKLEDQDH